MTVEFDILGSFCKKKEFLKPEASQVRFTDERGVCAFIAKFDYPERLIVINGGENL